MNAQTPRRGGHLVEGGRRAKAGGGWIARRFAGSFHRVMDRIDKGLDAGMIEARLPDGSVRILGGRAKGPAAEINLKDWRALVRLATGGSAGWYQAWEAGEWDSPDPVQIFALFMRNAASLGKAARAKGPWRWAARALHAARRNSRTGARANIASHYDLGNDFYALWLDPTMSYSSARWEGMERDADLRAAQANKVDLLAERLDLRPGQHVLEIGCGWGFLARRMAQRHKVQVTGISLSDEQLGWCRDEQRREGAEFIEYRRQDYRDVDGQFDAIASVEMVEAVGREYWPDFFACLARNLKPGGKAALQYICIREELFDAYAASADFIQTYVFPGGMLVSEREFQRLAFENGLVWRDRAAFGQDYARTLAAWRESFDAAVEDGTLPAGFDERFVRLWRYYLMYCEGGFLGGGIDVCQVTLVKG
ncbi:cyclopropane-fatty-acyl-phospholipid synthase family protein [Novosphingobium sp. ZN18A2]|uniref:cyclopropane-fatty-acyl-phospholipid synthase family protein n=1 Tax=Novosphingobium sp. ZN18A2 TaxID=3079861 RepID=UPI0030CACF5A